MDTVAGASTSKPSICFVSPNAYDAVSGRTVSGHIGGAEIQLAALAHGLCDRGYPVSFVTWDEGQPDGEDCSGIKVYKTCTREAGLRGLRFFHPRWSSLWAAMRRADASIYCQSIAAELTAQVAGWCRLWKRRFIFIVMTDSDCDLRLRYRAPLRKRLLRRYGLRNANIIVAQTETQQKLLQKNWGMGAPLVRPCVIEMPTRGPGSTEPGEENQPRVLWVGRFSPEKRLEWFLDLAERCPQVECDVVGGANADSAYADALIKRASVIANVSMHGRISHSAMADFYDRARLLVLTSKWEGMPSTFIEAWSRGLPTVSTVDPDALIERNRIGAVATTVGDLADAVQHLLSSPLELNRCSQRAIDYFRDNHSVRAAVKALENVCHGLGDDRCVRGAKSS